MVVIRSRQNIETSNELFVYANDDPMIMHDKDKGNVLNLNASNQTLTDPIMGILGIF